VAAPDSIQLDAKPRQFTLSSWKQAVLPGDFQSQTLQSTRTARDWVVDWALFLASAAFAVTMTLTEDGAFDRLWIVNGVFGGLACISLFWRRSHPLQVGILTSIGSCVAGASGLAWLIALYNAALRLDRNGFIWVLVISAVGFVTYPFLYPETDMGVLTTTALGLGVAGTAVGLGVLARARREHVMALVAAGAVAESEQRLREEQARVAERQRIAREMHDVLAHRISLLSLHAGALEYRDDISQNDISKAAGVIRASAQEALQELRDVIGVMRTGADEGNEPPQPGVADISKLISRFRDAGVRVDSEIDDDLNQCLSAADGRTLYRVVQEGLTNASKHAPGSRVSVVLRRTVDDRVEVSIENRLAAGSELGAVALAEPGVGLIGLRERTDLAGGKLEHRVHNGMVFRLRAEVPVTDA
jgi:signal transduction histidine kinase